MSEPIFLGTRKGTFVVEKIAGCWRPRLLGHAGVEVTYVARDPKTGTIFALLHHGHWGPKLSRSLDGGGSWEDTPPIAYPTGARYLDEKSFKPATLLKLWCLAFGPSGRIFVGTIPGGLFTSDDGGETFELDRALWNHASRGGDLFEGDGTGVTQWYGTPASEGGEFAPGIHSIVPDPRDPDHVLVAVSTAGVLETTDGGATWHGRNRGMHNDYLPDPHAEWGHDPHLVVQCPEQPQRLWQQNHCGVFHSADGGATWRDVSKPEQGVRFGFPIAVDRRDGRVAWVVPGKADNQRMAIDGGLFVAKTEDAGETWRACRTGLPQEHAYDVVYRHALDNTDQTLAFGSTTGNLYVSEDGGESWLTVANNLPPIYAVRFALASSKA